MTIFDDIGATFNSIGHEIGVFVTQTVPRVASDVYHDTLGITKELATLPKQALTVGGQTAQTLIQTTGSTVSSVVPATTKAAGDIFNSVFNSPVLIVAAIAAVIVLPKIL